MLDKTLNFAAGFFGLVLLASGLRWQIDPAGAAQGLGMPLLDGVARSTQIGDISAFFVTGGVFTFAALITRNATLMLTPLALVAFAALLRTGAWALQGADFTADFIAVEIVMSIVFFFAWRSLKAQASVKRS